MSLARMDFMAEFASTSLFAIIRLIPYLKFYFLKVKLPLSDSTDDSTVFVLVSYFLSHHSFLPYIMSLCCNNFVWEAGWLVVKDSTDYQIIDEFFWLPNKQGYIGGYTPVFFDIHLICHNETVYTGIYWHLISSVYPPLFLAIHHCKQGYCWLLAMWTYLHCKSVVSPQILNSTTRPRVVTDLC